MFVIIITLMGIIFVPGLASGQSKIDDVSGWIQVEPEGNFVQAEVAYQYVNRQPTKKLLEFYLDKHLKVTQLQCSKLHQFTLRNDKSSPVAELWNTLSIQFQEPLVQNEAVIIILSYQGSLPLYQFGDTPLPKNWMEIGANSISLTPFPVEFTPAAYNLEIKANSLYQVFSPGQTKKNGGGSTRIQSEVATMGVYFILGRNLQVETFTRGNNAVTLISDKASDSLKREVVTMTAWCLEYYNRTFGKRTAKRKVTVALRPVKKLDASYAAGENYFVTYDSQEDFFRRKLFHFGIISHEIGHFWWQHADFTSTHNWLNEGFADYVSLMAIRAYWGQDEFEKQIQNLQTKLAKLPDTLSLANYDARGKFGNVMSYSKGALLLHQLEEKIGETKLIELLTEVAIRKIKTNQEFIKVVKQILGAKEAKQMEKAIKNE